MSTRRVCDRSGKDIGGSKDPAQTQPDLVLSIPWCPALDGFTFEDLSDDQRLKVLDYLLTITQNSGKADRQRVLADCVAFGGGSLVPPVKEATAPPVEPVLVLDTSFEVPARGLEGKAGAYAVGELVEGTYLDGTPCVYQRHASGWVELGPPGSERVLAMAS